MNLKKLVGVFSVLTLALVLGSAMFRGGQTRAVTACSVPSVAYPSIQDAANDSGCTEIDVAAGAYFENVEVKYPTTIKGAQAGTDARGRVGLESTVNGANPIGANPVFTVKASGVTIDGFTVKNSITTGAAVGIDIKNTTTGTVITNNIIDGINTTDTGGNGTAQAVYLEAGPDNVRIIQNDMKNISGLRSCKGVLIGDSGSSNPSLQVTIAANAISNVTSGARGAYGVQSNNGNGSTLNTGLTITGNSINNLTGGGWVHAIGLEANIQGVTVRFNNISNLASTTVDVVGVWFEANPSFGTALVTSNNFNFNAPFYGIAVHPFLTAANPSASLRGECNWWNSSTGPTAASNPGGTGAQVSPGVSYRPWLNAPDPVGDCIGGLPPESKDQCKDGGWQAQRRADGSAFKNQGDCIQYVNTGK